MSQIHIPKKQRPAPVTEPAKTPEHRSGGAIPTAQDIGKRIQLDSAIQDKMERAFGADFSTVELYESPAVEAAGAQAVTMGNRISFAPDRTDFQSPQGQRLLGHELSHVVGQARGMVEGSGFLQNSGLEHLADWQGAMAAGGQTIPASSLQPLSASSIAAASGPMQAKKEPKTEEEKRELELRKQAKQQGIKQKALRENAAHFVKTSEDLMQTGKDIPMAHTMWDRAGQMQNLVQQSRATQQSLVDEANGIKSQRLAGKAQDWYAKASQSREAGHSIRAKAQSFMGWANDLRSKTAVKDGIGNKVKILVPELGNQLEQWMDQKLQKSELGQEFLKQGLVGTLSKKLAMNGDDDPLQRFLTGLKDRHEKSMANFASPEGQQAWAKMSNMDKFLYNLKNPLVYIDTKTKGGLSRTMDKMLTDRPIQSFLSKKISPILAGLKDRHEKAVANFISPEGQQAWAKMSDMDKFLYKLKNPLAYMDAKTKGGRGRAMGRIKREQAVDRLAEDMYTMDPNDFQVTPLTNEQRGTDMQNLFDEEKSMEQTGLYLTGDQWLEQQNGQDMRRLFDDSYQENDLAYVPEDQENIVASFMADKLTDSASDKLKPVQFVTNMFHSSQMANAGESMVQKSSAMENKDSQDAIDVVNGLMQMNAEVHKRRGLEHMTEIIFDKMDTPMAGKVAMGINKLAIDSEGVQKQNRRNLVQKSTTYDERFAYALDQLAPKEKRDAMSDVEKDILRRQAKHAALESIYGKGVETFHQAEAIEMEKRITMLRRQAKADPELMKLLVSELDIQSDFSDWDTKLPYLLSADYQQGETVGEHRQKLANKRQEKKNGLQTTVAKNQAKSLSFTDTLKKRFHEFIRGI